MPEQERAERTGEKGDAEREIGVERLRLGRGLGEEHGAEHERRRGPEDIEVIELDGRADEARHHDLADVGALRLRRRRCLTHRHDPVSLPCCAVPDSIALTRPHASNACEGPLRRRDAGRREPRRSNQARASGQFSAKQIQAHASKCKQKCFGLLAFICPNSGVINGLRQFQIKKFPFALLLAAGRPAWRVVIFDRPGEGTMDSDFHKGIVRKVCRVLQPVPRVTAARAGSSRGRMREGESMQMCMCHRFPVFRVMDSYRLMRTAARRAPRSSLHVRCLVCKEKCRSWRSSQSASMSFYFWEIIVSENSTTPAKPTLAIAVKRPCAGAGLPCASHARQGRCRR